MLADIKNKFLYECLPDYFPDGYLTDLEIELWGIYLEEKKARIESEKRK